jgi:3-isopropylmalate/(R)-2-methylmalate dehydratase small subunit
VTAVTEATGEKPETAKVILKLGDDVSTDAIYPGRFLATVLPSETPQYAFADYPEFNLRLRRNEISPGSVVVAGSNFGCGSSREQAASTIKGHGLVLVARGFARIFLQNAINLGLPTVTCPDIEADEGDEIAIYEDCVVNITSGKRFAVRPLAASRRAIVKAGGLIPFTRERLLKKQN